MLLPESIREIFSQSICLYTKEQVEVALDRMASAMDHVLADQNPIVLCVVVGGIIPLGNLLTRLNFPLCIDYIHATRYNFGTQGGSLNWLAEPTLNLEGRTVVIVDDILDSGLTLQALIEFCHNKKVASVYTAVLVDKIGARLPHGTHQADFVGLPVYGGGYVFGYGMDYKGYLRNAPGIYRIPEAYLDHPSGHIVHGDV